MSRFLAILLLLSMVIGLLPVTALAAPATQSTGGKLTVSDATDDLTLDDKQSIFEDNVDQDRVSTDGVPADDEPVKVIVELDTESLLELHDSMDSDLPMLDFQHTDAAQAQMNEILSLQESVMAEIDEKQIDAAYSFRYAGVFAGFSAEIPYGKIQEIRDMDGVMDVVLCETYYTDQYGETTLGEALSPAEVVDYANDTDFKGEGILIGILDTGLDYTHEAFANEPAVQKLQKDALSKLLYTFEEKDGKTNVTAYSYAALWYAQNNSTSTDLALLTEDQLYMSGKVPFAFDYADADDNVIPSATAVKNYGNDHGTHVAGIAAGKTVDAEGNVTFAGQAPEAQLAIFKVFSDSTSGASTDTVLAALNDAMLLGVDVINMSLGSGGGFSAEESGSTVAKYYDLVKAAGILLNCSAGNAYSSAQGRATDDFADVSDPDTGIISSSSSYDAALSVASVNASASASFAVGDQTVPFNSVKEHDFMAELLGDETDKTFEYVMIPNTGAPEDYEGLDVTGKIAVVMRGGLSFNDKQLNAAKAGAVACVIYNNRNGYLLNMAVDDYKIPTASIGYTNGLMMAKQENKVMTLSSSGEGAVTMSDFSSWGPLPSLELKPEITAPGGDIWSSLPFGEYGYMSGTSMASPYSAGTAAAALQYVNTILPGLSATEKQELVNQLLMSTADILYDTDGVAYSPRKQGAGLVNLDAVIQTPAYLTTRGSQRPKIELGDDPAMTGMYTLNFTIHNLLNSPVSYEMNTQVQTETASDGQIIQKGYALAPQISIDGVVGGDLEGSTVTVPAGGQAEVTLTVILSDADRAYLAQFPNGIYVEGFVELTNDDDPALSLPFLGFYGDWTKAPILEDSDIYNDEPTKMYDTTVGGVYANMYVLKLGAYPFTVPEGVEAPETSKDRISLNLSMSTTGITNLYYLQAGMLRGAKTADVVIQDSDTGEVYEHWVETNVRKAMYNASSGTVRPAAIGQIWPPLTGGGKTIPSNTRLTYTATLHLDTDSSEINENNTYSFDFVSDGEMPYVVDRDNLTFYEGEDGRMYLDVTLADNFYLAGATLYSAAKKTSSTGQTSIGPGANYYDGILPAVKEGGSVPGSYEEYTYTFDVTDFYQKLYEGTFYIVAYDYAMNQCAYKVVLKENPVTALTLSKTELTLPQKGYDTLTATVTPKDATDQSLTWTSSDPDVVEVRSGIVAAKAPGTAVITVNSSKWPDVKAQCQITVTQEVGPDALLRDIQLNTQKISMLEGTSNDRVYLKAYAPFYATDVDLVWSSSDESIVKVTAQTYAGNDTWGATVTAVGAGTATVTAKAKNSDASAEITIVVAAAEGTGSFNIVGDTLVAYTGTEATVTIPDGIRVVGDKAFYNNDSIQHVIFPDSVEEIGIRAFYDCDNLLDVKLPETMKSIGEGAFYYCEKMTTLGLDDKGVIPKGLTEISKNAFYYCKALKGDLVIPDTVTTIGASAFYNGYALTSITIPDSVTSLDAGGSQFNSCSAVTSLTLSANITELPGRALMGMKAMTSLPDLKNVTSIGQSCFSGWTSLTEATIPEAVTYLGGSAFSNNPIMTSVTVLGDPVIDGTTTFGKNVKLTEFTAPKLTTMGPSMFDGCTGFVNFRMPDHITTVGDKAFNNCSNLETIVFPASYSAPTLDLGLTPFVNCKKFTGFVIEDGANVKLEDGILYTGDGKTLVSVTSDFKGTSLVVPEGVEKISSYAAYKNTALKTVTLPDSLKEIGRYAFAECTGLGAVALPDGFTTLGEYAFNKCSGLTSVTFGKSLTAVPKYAFTGASKLKSVVLPDTVKTIGEAAFKTASALTTLSLFEGLESIDKDAFYDCKVLTKIILPQSLKTIGTKAFYNCYAATEIDCGGLTEIPDSAFRDCRKAVKLTLSDGVTTIGPNAFYDCYELKTVTWPSQLETIGKQAFDFCRKLESLDLSGTKLTSIGDSAFYQAYVVKDLVLPETLTTIGARAFGYLCYNGSNAVTEVRIPASVTSIASDAFYYANRLKSIVVDEGNPVYTSANGILFVKETGDIHIWPMANETTEFVVPENMTVIPAKILENNKSIKKIVIHSKVTAIGANAFAGSNVEEVVFEPSANGIIIGNYAFYNCQSLKKLELPYGLTAVGSYTFEKTGLESIEIPDTVTYMGARALAYNAKLKSVKLPASLTALSSMMFREDTALTELTIPAGVSDLAITDGASPFDGCTALKNVYVAKGSLYYKSVDGVVFDRNGATLRYYPLGRTDTSYIIPEGTVRIGVRAFIYNESLTTVSFPSTLVRVGPRAFMFCNSLKDFYFNGMVAPMLECNASNSTVSLGLYNNFVGLWIDASTLEFKDYELNLYYPEGAQGYDAFVWVKYFNTAKRPAGIMDASYFTPADLVVQEVGQRNAQLSWTAPKQAKAEHLTYTVERSVAVRVQDGEQDTWVFDGFETLAQGLTDCAYLDETTLDFGLSYAYRVTAYNAKGVTGPGAIGTISIRANSENPDELSVEELIEKIEALKPLANLTAEDEAAVRALLDAYNALTEEQKALVSNYDTLLKALELVGHNFGQWTVVKAPTQKDAGTAERICSVCGKTERKEIPATGAGTCYYKSFTDCTADWYHEAVDYVVSQKLMVGTSATTFNPSGSMNRAMLVAVLYRMAGSPEVKADSGFTDVAKDAWYAKAVAWAKEQGVVYGTTATTFSPNALATREQIVTILWRYAGKPAAKGNLSSFKDASSVSDYAKDAMAWAVGAKILYGNGGKINAKNVATRAEFACIITRYLGGSYLCKG